MIYFIESFNSVIFGLTFEKITFQIIKLKELLLEFERITFR